MGQDQKIRRKHKQRTTEHKKHSVFPGMWIPKDVQIQSGVIKPITKPFVKEKVGSFTKTQSDNPLWAEVDRQHKILQGLAGSSALATRRAAESNYRYAYRRLAQAGEVRDVRKKYRG